MTYGGVKASLTLYFSVCDRCGADWIGAVQAKLNHRVMVGFRKQVDGLLDATAIWEFRKRFALTQQEAATLLGGGKIAFSRYEYNEVAQSESMDTLLRLCAAVPENLRHIAQIKGVRLSEKTIALLDEARTYDAHGIFN